MTGAPIKEYNKAKDVSEYLYEDLHKILEQDFPLADIPTLLEKERASHEAFAESRARVYIGRQHYFDAINEHLLKAGIIFLRMKIS